MPNKYILWRVSNGWLMTTDDNIYQAWDNRKNYAIFKALKEFSDWVPPSPGEPLHYNPPAPQPPIRRKPKSLTNKPKHK